MSIVICFLLQYSSNTNKYSLLKPKNPNKSKCLIFGLFCFVENVLEYRDGTKLAKGQSWPIIWLALKKLFLKEQSLLSEWYDLLSFEKYYRLKEKFLKRLIEILRLKLGSVIYGRVKLDLTKTCILKFSTCVISF